MDVVYELTETQIQELHDLFKNEWWTKQRTLEDTRQCVQGSQICIGLVDDTKLAGFVRVITDYTFKALIFDLIIKKQYRNKSLGKKLIHLVKSHEAIKDVPHFELYCLPELRDFYRSCGFTDDINGIELLRYNNA